MYNFVVEKDYLTEAKKLFNKDKYILIKSKTGWTNIYNLITFRAEEKSNFRGKS